MVQNGINNRVLNICHQEIQGYEYLFEGNSFDAGYLDAVERQVGMVITGGRVEYRQTLWKMVGDGIIKYTQSGDWSSKFEMIHTCTCEVDKGDFVEILRSEDLNEMSFR